VADYWKRIKQQEAQYEEVTPDEGPFIKIMNVGEKIVVNRIEGECMCGWNGCRTRRRDASLDALSDVERWRTLRIWRGGVAKVGYAS
jgi:hypothetical protein